MIFNKLVFIILLLNTQKKIIKLNRSFLSFFFFNYFKFFFLKKFYQLNYALNNSLSVNKQLDNFINKYNNVSWIYVLDILNNLKSNTNIKFYPSNYYLRNIFIYLNLFSLYKDNSLYTKNTNKMVVGLNNFFLKKFIEVFFNKKCFLKFNQYDVQLLDTNNIYLSLYKRLKKFQMFGKSGTLLREFLEISLILIYTKDLRLFKNWVIKVSENMHFKLHRKFFYVFKIVFQRYFLLYFKYFGCLGFYFKVKGKIGLGGNSKKKRNIIKIGKFSLTSKKLKIKYDQGQIRTYSGTLGVEFLISYL